MNMIPQVAAATKETCLTIVCIFEDKMAAPTCGGKGGGCLWGGEKKRAVTSRVSMTTAAL